MSRRKPPKELLERRKESKQKKSQESHTPQPSHDWKTWAGRVIAGVGLLGTVMSAIALWLTIVDRPTVSLGPQREAGDLFSTEVRMTNNGLLPISKVSFAIFAKSIDLVRAPQIVDVIVDKYEPPTGILKPGEPVTTTFRVLVLDRRAVVGVSPDSNGNTGIRSADIAMIASFRPAWAPFWIRTRPFRFKTFQTSAGIVFEQVPAEDIEEEYKKSLLEN